MLFSRSFRFFLVACIALVYSHKSVARPIAEDKACAIATRFYYMKKLGDDICKVKSLKALDLVYSPLHGKELRLTPPEYYVFAPENRKGFVIVSGDDRALQPVVGYSLDAPICNKLSSSLLGYLNCYAGYIEALRKGEISPKPKRITPSVTPFLTTRWGQRSPYNYFCPELNGHKTLTGCVTTAVAQIMKFYAWPMQGKGIVHAEIHNMDTVYSTVVLGDTYSWAQMKDNYSSSSRLRVMDVACLMRDVGHAVNMKYGSVLSATGSANVLTALTEHFHYSPTMRQVHRSQYTDDEWNRLIADELSAHRPVYYDAHSTRYDAHAFVICGIDDQGRYYVNWGWGGQCDGYFDFDAVSAGKASYSYVQNAIIGICPPCQ